MTDIIDEKILLPETGLEHAPEGDPNNLLDLSELPPRPVDDAPIRALVENLASATPTKVEVKSERRYHVGKWVARAALGITLAAAGGVDAVALLHGQDVQINGIELSVKPTRQDYSHVNLGLGGHYYRPEHANIQGVDIGAQATVEDAGSLQLENPLLQAGAARIIQHPQPAAHRIAEAATRDFWVKGGITAGGIVGLELLGLGVGYAWRKTYGGNNGNNLTLSQQRFNKRVGRTVSLLVIGSMVATYSYAADIALSENHRSVSPNGELDGPLASIMPLLQPGSDDTLVKTAKKNTDTLLAQHPELVPKGSDWVRVAVIDDPENNDDMASETGTIASDVNADYVVANGDMATFEDSGFGMYTADALAATTGKRPIYEVPGDHDTEKGEHYSEADGFIIASGKTQVINGLRTLMIPSVSETTLNSGVSGSVLRDPNIDQATSIHNAVQEIKENHPQVVFAHDYQYMQALAEALIKDGNVTQMPLLFGGRSYTGEPTEMPTDPTEKDITIKGLGTNLQTIGVDGYTQTANLFIAGSGGGHRDTSVQFQLQGPSNQNVLFYNKKTGAIEILVFTINLDGTVKAKLKIVNRGIAIPQAAGVPAISTVPTSGVPGPH